MWMNVWFGLVFNPNCVVEIGYERNDLATIKAAAAAAAVTK